MTPEPLLTAILAGLGGQAQLCASAADVLRALYALPAAPEPQADPSTDEPRASAPAAVDPPPRRRRRLPEPVEFSGCITPGCGDAPAAAPAATPGKYDAGILRALRSEQGQYGLPTSDDITRLAVPGVKREQFSSVNSSVDYALRRLQTLGLVTHEGRIWKAVEA